MMTQIFPSQDGTATVVSQTGAQPDQNLSPYFNYVPQSEVHGLVEQAQRDLDNYTALSHPEPEADASSYLNYVRNLHTTQINGHLVGDAARSLIPEKNGVRAGEALAAVNSPDLSRLDAPSALSQGPEAKTSTPLTFLSDRTTLLQNESKFTQQNISGASPERPSMVIDGKTYYWIVDSQDAADEIAQGQRTLDGNIQTLLAKWSDDNGVKPNVRVNEIYRDIAGINPTQEQTLQGMLLLVKQHDIAQIRNIAAHTPEARANVISVYEKIIGKTPDDKLVATLQNKLAELGSLERFSDTLDHSVQPKETNLTTKDSDAEAASSSALLSNMTSFLQVRSEAVQHDDLTAPAQNDENLVVAQLGRVDDDKPVPLNEQVIDIYRAITGSDPTQDQILEGMVLLAQKHDAMLVANIAAHTPEARENVVKIYERVVGQSPSDDVVALYQNRLANLGSLDNLSNTISHSTAAEINIKLAYALYSGSPSDAETTAAWQDKLAHGANISEVRTEAAHSDYAKSLIRSHFLTITGAEPPAYLYEFWETSLATDTSASQLREGISHGNAATQSIIDTYKRITNQDPSASYISEWQDKLGQSSSAYEMRKALTWTPTFRAEFSKIVANAGLTGVTTELSLLFPVSELLASGGSYADVQSFVAHSDVVHNNLVNAYLSFTNLTPSEEIVQKWQDSLMTDTSAAQIREEIINSSATRDTIDNTYQQILGRSATDAEVAHFKASYADNGTAKSMRHEIAFSDEAVQIIRNAFTASGIPMFATDAAVKGWESQLDNGLTRENLVKKIEQLAIDLGRGPAPIF